MKRRLWLLPLVLLFIIGSAGHILLRPAPLPEEAYLVTLTANAPALICAALPAAGTPVMLGGCRATVTHSEVLPLCLYGRKDGESISREAILQATLRLQIEVDAREREGRFYLDGHMILLGDEVTVTGQNFRISASVLGFEHLF